jgi:hypothetical protein
MTLEGVLMLLAAALTTLALLGPVAAPSTIEATRTTTRDGDVLIEDESVVIDRGLPSEKRYFSHDETMCVTGVVRDAICDGLEMVPEYSVRVARVREDSKIRVTTDVSVEGGLVGVSAWAPIDCVGTVGGTACTVYDVLEALED